MSLLTIALCLIQMTALLLLAGLAARLLRPLAPAQAAKIGAVGLLLSLSVVVISFTGIRKPFVTKITASPPSLQQAHSDESSAESSVLSARNAIAEPASRTSNSARVQMSMRELVQLLDSTFVEPAADHSVAIQPLNACLLLMLIAAIVPTLIGLFATAQLHGRSTPITGDDERRLREFVCDQFRNAVRFRASRFTTAPCVTFVGGRTVYLPTDWPNWNDNELSASIAHEVEHLKRRDPLVRLLTQIAASLQRFHPLATWLQQSVILSQEMAADRHAADRHAADHTHRSTAYGGRNEYAATLSKIALRLDTRIQSKHSRMKDWILGAGTLSVSSSQLIRRIEMLTRNPSNTNGAQRRLVASVIMLSVVGVWMLSASWSVRAQPPANSPGSDRPAEDVQSENAPRIARLVEKDRVPNQSIRRPAAQPWEDIGKNDTGYAVVHVDALLSKVAMLQQFVSDAVDSYLDQGWQAIVSQEFAGTRKSMGMSIANLQTVAVGFNFDVTSTPPKDVQDNNSKVTMGANNGRIWFKQPVAHDPIARALNVDKIAKLIADGGTTVDDLDGKSHEEFTRKIIDGMFTERATTESLGFSPSDDDEESEEEEPGCDLAQFEKLQRAWQQVDGGDVSLCFSLPKKLGYVDNEDDEMADAMLQHMACLGIGLDFDGTQFVNARFAMVPRNGISDAEFRDHLHSVENRIAEQIEVEMEDSESEFLARLGKRVFDSRVVRFEESRDQREGGAAAVVEVRMPVEWLTLLMMM